MPLQHYRPAEITVLAGKSTHLAEIEFNNVKVQEENILGKEGCGFSYIVSTALDNGRYSIAWAGVGIAQELLDSIVNYSRKRSQFGKKIYRFQHDCVVVNRDIQILLNPSPCPTKTSLSGINTQFKVDMTLGYLFTEL